MSLAQQLSAGIVQAGLDVAASTQQRLLDYLALMQKWNKVHNLTAVRKAEDMVTLHLLDSLAVLPHVGATSLLDVGSGAGLPGIVLALCRPELQVTVLDSNNKKASFMRQAKAELGIDNLEVMCGRVEEFQPQHFRQQAPFDVVISRAFSDLALFIRLTRHLCAEGGQWLAMKGVYPEQELAQLEAETNLVPSQVLALQVPGLDAQRHLVFLPNA